MFENNQTGSEKVRHISKNNVWEMNSRVARRNLEIEKKMAKTIFAMIGVYCACWTPYAIVSFWAAFGEVSSLPVWAQSAPALIAKSGTMWNPMIYVATNKQFRGAFVEGIPCRRLREMLAFPENTNDQVNTRDETMCEEMCAVASGKKSDSSSAQTQTQFNKIVPKKGSKSPSQQESMA